jgi:formamidopyrimidine-DNA glycosylase
MPEIVEVYLTCQYLLSKLKNHNILNIVSATNYKKLDKDNLKILKDTYPLKITDIKSKGKLMWFQLYSNKKEKTYYIMNGFGLFGDWNFEKISNIRVTIKSDNINYSELYYSDTMNFGHFKIVDNINDLYKKLDVMGDDFLQNNFLVKDIEKRISLLIPKKSDLSIYEVLIEQETKKGSIGCGIGSYLASEICYNAKISPLTKIIDIYKDNDKIKTLTKSIKYLIKSSLLLADMGYFEHMYEDRLKFINKFRDVIFNDPDSEYNFHKSIKIKKTDKFVFNVYRQKKDLLENEVCKIEIKKRSVYWAPAVQK